MITLPITKLQMTLSMLIAEVWLVSDPKYSVRIGSENYFSFAVAAAVGLFFIFFFCAIRFGYGIQFNEERISLGRGLATKLAQKQNLPKNSK